MRHGVDDGTRTHDNRDHNPGLYQLSYAHRRNGARSIRQMARPEGLEPPTIGLEIRCSIQLSYGRVLRLPVGGRCTSPIKALMASQCRSKYIRGTRLPARQGPALGLGLVLSVYLHSSPCSIRGDEDYSQSPEGGFAGR